MHAELPSAHALPLLIRRPGFCRSTPENYYKGAAFRMMSVWMGIVVSASKWHGKGNGRATGGCLLREELAWWLPGAWL